MDLSSSNSDEGSSSDIAHSPEPAKCAAAVAQAYPNFDQEEIEAFQAWYIDHKVKVQTTLCQTINALLTQVEDAEAAGDVRSALSRHGQAKDLKFKLKSMDEPEYMRQQMWHFKASPTRTL